MLNLQAISTDKKNDNNILLSNTSTISDSNSMNQNSTNSNSNNIINNEVETLSIKR